MADPADKKPKSATLRTLFIGAALGATATLTLPMAAREAMTVYRNGEEARNLRMTVDKLYSARAGLAPRISTAIGIDYDVVNVPARGVNNADDIWRSMREGCTYDVTAFGYRTRELGINPVLMRATHYPTPECPTLPTTRIIR